MKPYKKLISLAFVLGVMVAGFAPAAHAVPMLRLTPDSGIPVTVADGGGGDLIPDPGIVGFNGAVGVFNIVSTAGLTKPALGTAAKPELSLSIFVMSNAAGALKIEFGDTDFSAPDPVGVAASIGGTTEGTVSYATYRDPGNNAFGTSELLTVLGPFTPLNFDDTTYAGIPSATGPYALTLALDITHPTGQHATSFGASLTANPEPGTVMLFGTGLLGMIGYGWRRRRQTA